MHLQDDFDRIVSDRDFPALKPQRSGGPYAETKEQLAGFFILEARDLNHAIQLMSKHPVVRGGPIEIQPAADYTEMNRERERRRSQMTR